MYMAWIYRILHKDSGKCYVGHTSRRLSDRWKVHRYDLRRLAHHSQYLQNAWNKYGAEEFVFEIIEECSEETKLSREQWFIENLNSCYNIAPVAGSALGLRHTEGAKQKISIASQEWWATHEPTESQRSAAREVIRENRKNSPFGPGYYPAHRIGAKDSQEVKDKRTAAVQTTKALKGQQRWIHHGDEEQQIGINDPVPDGWEIGRRSKIGEISRSRVGETRTDQAKQNMRSSAKDAWSDPDKRAAMLASRRPFRWITDGINSRKIFDVEDMPEGWKFGRTV